MKVLIVCSKTKENKNFQNNVSPFIYEQYKALKKIGIAIDIFLIERKGLIGYLTHLIPLRKKISEGNYDLIHAHVGVCGLLSILQRKVPVIITFHGTDINKMSLNILSSIVSFFSKWRIFVSKKLYNKILLKPKKNYNILPCGIDLDTFYPIDKYKARKMLNLSLNKRYILFSSTFHNRVKNAKLAIEAVKNLRNVVLVELKKKTREEVNLLLSACDLMLLTSFYEGSPQIVKEAMACNCPIVSTDVGDVREVIGKNEGCYITSYEPEDVTEKLKMALAFGERTDGREHIRYLDSNIIAKKIIKLYGKVLGKNR